MNFIFGKALLSLLFYTDNPYFFTPFSKFLSLLFPYFSVDGHLKACPITGHNVKVEFRDIEYSPGRVVTPYIVQFV